MEIILLERIERLGQMGDVVKVKDGYARNYLLPTKKALRKTKDNMALFEAKRKEYEAHNIKLKSEAEDLAAKLQGLSVVIIRQAAETGQLYGSVTMRDVCDAVREAGFKVERSQIDLAQPFKNLGIFDVRLSLHPDVAQTVRVNIARSSEEAKRAFKKEKDAQKVAESTTAEAPKAE
ncbi:MAG: 50S ribosomal protein L9 [Alphaproteobacteria bacterium]|nr:50S ribosomal protein L9 [Alphaproteobacteria bacterium]